MTKVDDSTLNPTEQRAVELRVTALLDRASAWGRFPTPVKDILAAANLKVAPTSAFDPASLLAHLRGKAAAVADRLKSALSKVLGLYDAGEQIIHIDETVGRAKQTFLKLHETGHHELPTHRKVFRFFQDCERTLAPEIADQFEREANHFARFALFQGDAYQRRAADMPLAIRTPMNLAKKFGASVYASCREFARTNHRACIVYILEPIEFTFGAGARAAVRRIEASPSFLAQFGRPSDSEITLDHPLGRVLPIGRKMTRPVSLSMTDRAGTAHECLAEAFDTGYNVLLLAYPVQALAASTPSF